MNQSWDVWPDFLLSDEAVGTGWVNSRIGATIFSTVDAAWEISDISPEVQADIVSRRAIWKELITQLRGDESLLEIHHNWISMPNHRLEFALYDDSEKATFEQLKGWRNGWLRDLENFDSWQLLKNFTLLFEIGL